VSLVLVSFFPRVCLCLYSSVFGVMLFLLVSSFLFCVFLYVGVPGFVAVCVFLGIFPFGFSLGVCLFVPLLPLRCVFRFSYASVLFV